MRVVHQRSARRYVEDVMGINIRLTDARIVAHISVMIVLVAMNGKRVLEIGYSYADLASEVSREG